MIGQTSSRKVANTTSARIIDEMTIVATAPLVKGTGSTEEQGRKEGRKKERKKERSKHGMVGSNIIM